MIYYHKNHYQNQEMLHICYFHQYYITFPYSDNHYVFL